MNRPRTRSARAAPRRAGIAGLLLGLACSGLAALLITVMGASILPRLLAPIQEAGAAVPWLTRTFATGYGLVWLGPVLVVLVWRLGGALGNVMATLAGVATMLVGGAVTVLAMYLAVFAQTAAF